MSDEGAPRPDGSTTNEDAAREYIRAHARTHTREAIFDALVAAGHDRATVERIWKQEWNAVAVADPPGTGLRRLAMALFVTGAVVGGGAALFLAAYMSGESSGSPGLFLLVYAVGYLGLGLGLWWLVGWVARRVHFGGGLSVVIGILLLPAYGVLMFGGCLAAASLAGG